MSNLMTREMGSCLSPRATFPASGNEQMGQVLATVLHPIPFKNTGAHDAYCDQAMK